MTSQNKSHFKETEIGKPPEDWENRQIGEVCQLIRSQFIPTEDDIRPYIGLEHIEQGTLRLVGVGKSSEVASNKLVFKKGQVLFGKLRPYFRKVYRPSFDGVCSTDIYVIDAKNGYDNSFLFYFFANQDIIDEATNSSEGTRMPRASWDYLSELARPFPPLPEQHAIAKILSDLDAKIELNHQMNQTLQQIGEALFKRWFVDFEFPNEQGKPYKSSGGEMVDSELGEIPEGWRIGKVVDEFNLTMGQSPPGSSYNEKGEGIAFFQGRTDFGFRYPSVRMFCNAPTRFANGGDTLVSVRAPVGDINMTLIKCCIGRGLAAIRHKTGSRSYTYYTLKNLRPEFEHFEARGTVFGCINKTDFENLKMLIPHAGLIEMFENKVYSLDQQIETNISSMEQLSQIRDSLLPKLMSGEIRVNLRGST